MSEEKNATGIEPFLLDYGDPGHDKGERWPIGKRKSVAEGKPIEGVNLPKKSEPQEIEVCLIVRRMPQDIHREMEEHYARYRDVKDMFGNTRPERYFKIEDQRAFLHAKHLWVWADTENLVLGVQDGDAAALYSAAFSKDVKVGQYVRIDGHLTQPVKEHLLNRYAVFRENLTEAINYLESKASQERKDLLGN